jgi:hypothetical protein
MGQDRPVKTLLPLTLLVLVSCGGKVTTELADASVQSDAAAIDAGVDAAEDDRCIQLLKALEPLRAAARSCCSSCNSIQCDQSAEDVCCPISVTGKRLASATFIEAVQAFKAECHPACPATPCPQVPSGNCPMGSMLCQP